MKKLVYSLILILIFSPLVAQEYEDTKETMPVLKVKPRLSDRIYIRSTLLEVFGPSAETTIHELIFKRNRIFNGPCDVYEQVRTSKKGVVDPHSSCFEMNSNSNLSLIGSDNLLRSGYMAKACLILVNTKSTLDHSLKAAGLNMSSDSKTKKNFNKAYKLFYPFKEINNETFKAFKKLTDNLDRDKKWPGVINLLCIDPGWQVL